MFGDPAASSVTSSPARKPEPERFVMGTVVPRTPESGVMPVTDGAGAPLTPAVNTRAASTRFMKMYNALRPIRNCLNFLFPTITHSSNVNYHWVEIPHLRP